MSFVKNHQLLICFHKIKAPIISLIIQNIIFNKYLIKNIFVEVEVIVKERGGGNWRQKVELSRR